jgi:hypothetical protein
MTEVAEVLALGIDVAEIRAALGTTAGADGGGVLHVAAERMSVAAHARAALGFPVVAAELGALVRARLEARAGAVDLGVAADAGERVARRDQTEGHDEQNGAAASGASHERLAHRKPTSKYRAEGTFPVRLAARRALAGARAEPPR